jgi:hypothetical protein
MLLIANKAPDEKAPSLTDSNGSIADPDQVNLNEGTQAILPKHKSPIGRSLLSSLPSKDQATNPKPPLPLGTQLPE